MNNQRSILFFCLTLTVGCTPKKALEGGLKFDPNKYNIEKISHGYDSLQIRIWYFPAYAPLEIPIVTIYRTAGQWTGTLRKVGMDFIEDTTAAKTMTMRELFVPTIVRSQILTPRSNWDSVSKTLESLGILTLPNMDEIPGFQNGMLDGFSYTVEIATDKQYRIYNYDSPENFSDRFLQAKNMVAILDLVDDELGVPWNIDDPDRAKAIRTYYETADTVFLRN
jgi:hypothetical protein